MKLIGKKKLLAVVMSLIMVITTLIGIPMATKEVQAAEVSDFVTTNGTKFWYQGGEFYYGGTNCYYINFKGKKDVDRIFEGAEKMGITVLRTWGNLDAGVIQKGVTNEGKQVFQNSADGSGEKDGVYYQYFDEELGRPVVNEGENGIQHLDYCIAQAKKHNVKLLITFTNNWQQFGGMQQYVNWAGLSNHDDFYTNETIKGWYKDYVKTLLEHENVYTGVKYKDDPTIFAWELANEPRASSDQYGKEGILYNWVKEMSAYVKELDPNHMVAIGDEGFFNYEYNSPDVPEGVADPGNWIWHGSEGVDYEKLMTIDTIDFGTPHLYIEDWNMAGNGGAEGVEATVDAWLSRHAEASVKVNKPVILEEFGYNQQKEGKYYDTIEEFFTWIYDKTEEYGYAGTNFWMLADFVEANGSETNTPYINYDGFNVYSCTLEEVKAAGITDESILKRVEEREPARQIIIDYCAKMAAKADNNGITPENITVDLANLEDVSIALKLQTGSAFEQLTMADKVLAKGTDYIIDGEELTITKEFLSSLEEGFNYLTVGFSQGKNPELILDVVDSRVISAKSSLTQANFDKNPKSTKNIVIPVTINDGGDLKAVKLRGEGSKRTELKADTDYTYTEEGTTGTVTIKAGYLATLIGEQAVFELDYTKGSDVVVTVILKDTTGLDIVDDFEHYASDTELNAAWVKNNYGSHAEGSIVTDVTNSKAMKYRYELGNYCGLTKAVNKLDVSAFAGVQFWYQPDASGQTLKIQLKDEAGNYWEKDIALDSDQAETVQIPFQEFNIKEGYGDVETVLNQQVITEFSIYAEKVGDKNNQSYLYFDDIEFYADGSDVQDGITTEELTTTEKITTEEMTTTEKVTTEEGIATEEMTTTETTTTEEMMTTEKATTEEMTTTEKATTEELTTTEKATTEEMTTTEKTTTEEVTTTEKTTTEEMTTTEKATTEEVTTTEKVTTEEVITTEEVTTTEEATTRVLTTTEDKTEVTSSTATEKRTEVTTNAELTTEKRTEVTTNTEGTTEKKTEGIASTEITTENRTEATTQEKDAITGITITPETTQMLVGSYVTLVAIVEPATADQKVVWSSSNKEVAIVDSNGKVIAKKAGTVVIEAVSADGKKSAECTITVNVAEEKPVVVESVEVNVKELSLDVGITETLQASITPSDAQNKEVVWSTNNASVATVEKDGTVTATGAGTAIITVTTVEGGKTASCVVTVKEKAETNIAVTKVSLSKKELTIRVGETEKVTAVVEPSDATNQEVSYESDNNAVAQVNANGEITGVSTGTVVIKVTTKDGGKLAFCVVTVENNPVDQMINVSHVTLNESNLTLTVGESQTLTATILPVDATNQKLVWYSSDEKVATVDSDGKVTAMADGAATIVAQAEDSGIAAFCTVTVKKKEALVTTIAVKDISVDTSAIILPLKKTKTLTATILPANATEQKITYTSSNSSVATVSSTGVIKAVAPGVTIIKVKAGSVEKKVTIKVKPGKVTSITKKNLSKTKIRLSWKKQSKVTGYKVYRYNTKTGTYKLYKITKKNYVSVANLKKNTTCKFKIKAYKKSGSVVINGDYSKIYTIKK